MPCSATCFLEVGARLSLKIATKGSTRFLGCFSKDKTEECDLKVGNAFDQFGIAIPFLATYFLEVRARVSLKVATKGSIRGKENSQNLDF